MALASYPARQRQQRSLRRIRQPLSWALAHSPGTRSRACRSSHVRSEVPPQRHCRRQLPTYRPGLLFASPGTCKQDSQPTYVLSS